MSDEPAGLIDDIFMQKTGVKYPFVRAGGVNQLYAVPHFPAIYCIAPDGTLLSMPGDGLPSEAVIEAQLKLVELVPAMPAEARFDEVRSMWTKREHKKLMDHLDKALAQQDLDEATRAVFTEHKAELQRRLDRRLERIPELGKGPDYLDSQQRLEDIAAEWKDLPPAAAAREQLARFEKDATIKKEIAALKALQKLISSNDPAKAAQRRKLIEELLKFPKKYAGTHAAAKAGQIRSELLTGG